MYAAALSRRLVQTAATINQLHAWGNRLLCFDRPITAIQTVIIYRPVVVIRQVSDNDKKILSIFGHL